LYSTAKRVNLFFRLKNDLFHSTLLGEEVWPTQPFPTKPAPFVRHVLTENDLTDISPESNAFIKEKVKGAKVGTIFTPPGTEGVLQFPGTRGGAEWGGASVDPNMASCTSMPTR
jgi:quinoprotein glucose dehydrogenase